MPFINLLKEYVIACKPDRRSKQKRRRHSYTLLYLINISIYIILANIRIEPIALYCICNTITPKAKDKLQKYSKTIEYCNLKNMQMLCTAFFCASSVIILPEAKSPQNALKCEIEHIFLSRTKIHIIKTKGTLLLYII